MTGQRQPRERDVPYMLWIKRLPCVGCAVVGKARYGTEACHNKLAIAAHGWREGGIGEKGQSDRRCLPLCPTCHRGDAGEHMSGMRAFWDFLGICPACLAEQLNAAFDAGEDGMPVILAAVRGRRLDGGVTC